MWMGKCPVCLSNISGDYAENNCGHLMCQDCYERCVAFDLDRCPLCRADLNKNKVSIDSNWLLGDPKTGLKINWRIKRKLKQKRRDIL